MPSVRDQAFDLVPIEELTTHPENARRGDVSAIAASIAANDFYGALVVQRSSNRILVGNHRYLAARDSGIDALPVLYVDVDDDRARRILLADNRTNDFASYDDAALLELLTDLAATDDVLAGTGYTEADLAALQADSEQLADALDADDDTSDGHGSIYSDELIKDAAFKHFRAAGFPYPDVPRYLAMQQINALAATPTDKLFNSVTAYHVADPYQRHRFTTPVPGKVTPLQAYEHDDKMRHALTLALDNGRITPTSLLGVLGYVRGAQCAAQFRPGFALLMYRRFARAGATVLDTSTGFGGRLTAFFASDCSEYIGIDPSTRTDAGNRKLVGDLCPASKRVELICAPAEDVPHETLRERADFAFTSPPYFAKERYADEPTQSCVRYSGVSDWRDGFLQPMMRLQHAALRDGSHSVVNIADVKIDNETHPLVDYTIDAAQRAGFTHVDTERFPLPRVPGRGEAADAFEPLLIFRK